MGSKNSKEIGQEEEEEEDSAYDPLKIQWDKYGNLRYGIHIMLLLRNLNNDML